jgi:hypothetical protein
MAITKLTDVEDAETYSEWVLFENTLKFKPEFLVYHLEAPDDAVIAWMDEHADNQRMAFMHIYSIAVFANHQDAIDCALRFG